MILQFDYYPVLRSDDEVNSSIASNDLRDVMDTYWNDEECWSTLELSKEQMEKGSITRTANINIKEHNILKIAGKQIWKDKFIKQTATIELSKVSDDEWKIIFTNLIDAPTNEFNYFNNKFGIGCEKFHFKLNGEALIVNQEIKAEELYKVTNTFKWKGNTPLLFEMEEYGYAEENVFARFIQCVRWTIK
jgi:hypothetical protein